MLNLDLQKLLRAVRLAASRFELFYDWSPKSLLLTAFSSSRLEHLLCCIYWPVQPPYHDQCSQHTNTDTRLKRLLRFKGMDHLSEAGTDKLDIKIPYLCVIQYDGGSFHDFPLRHGYTFEKEHPWLIKIDSLDQNLLAFFQSWLYFGLMTDFFGLCGITIRPQDFTRETTMGTVVLHTYKLAELISSWTKKLLSGPQSRRLRRKGSALACLMTALKYATYLDQPHRIGSQGIGPWKKIFLSIKILITTLAAPLHCSNLINFLVPWHKGFRCVLPTGTLLQSLMYKNGWCPFRMEHLFSRLTYSSIFVLASINTSNVHHTSHKKCRKKRMCLSDSIPEHYTGRHIESCNGHCQHTELPTDQSKKIKTIIQKDEIPLLSIDRGCHDANQVQVVEGTPSMQYTAITHVWADGLGKLCDLAGHTRAYGS